MQLKIPRHLGAVLLAVTLCLPMSRCSPFQSFVPTQNITKPPQKETAKIQYNYLLSLSLEDWNPKKSVSEYLIVSSFLLPLGVIFASSKPKLRHLYNIALCLEILPIGFSAYVVAVFGWYFGEPLIGFYTGTSGAVLCALIWIVDVIMLVRTRVIRTP